MIAQSSGSYSPYAVSADAEFCGHLMPGVSKFISTPYVGRFVLCDCGVVIVHSMISWVKGGRTPFLNSICNVVLIGAQEQMVRIYTWSNIATMENVQGARVATKDAPRGAVGGQLEGPIIAPNVGFSIAGIRAGIFPKPAAAIRIILNTLKKIFSEPSVVYTGREYFVHVPLIAKRPHSAKARVALGTSSGVTSMQFRFTTEGVAEGPSVSVTESRYPTIPIL